MQNDTKIALGFGAVIIMLLFVGTTISRNTPDPEPPGSNVSIEDGIQIIDITAKGGYSPSRIEAEAGIPTEIRFATNGTYDCSSVVAIPQLGFQEVLPARGTRSVALTADQATGTLQGQCAMGMYNFQIAFE